MSRAFEPYQSLEEDDVHVVEDSLTNLATLKATKTKAQKRRAAALIFSVCLFVSVGAAAVFFSHQGLTSHSSKQSTSSQSQQSALNSSGGDNLAVGSSKKPSDELPCIGDKLYNEVPLERGQYVCSENGNYAVGFDDVGDFVWLNLQEKIEAPYYNHDNAITAASPAFFMLEQDGTIVLYESNSDIVWSKEPKQEMGVNFQDKCLHGMYACPFLKLHNDGVLVLRWQTENEEWTEHNLYKVYGEGTTEDNTSGTAKPDDSSHPSFPNEEDEKKLVSISDVVAVHHVGAGQAFQCVGDRLSNGAHLEMGEFVCSQDNSYVIGLTQTGDFVWMDLASGDVKAYYNHTDSGNAATPSHFAVGQKGSFIVFDSSNKQIWKKEALAEQKEEISFHPKCLLGKFDCPYLHLHNDGFLVVNWVDAAGWVVDHDVKKVYGFFRENEQTQT
jgi:hypothetical protein